MVLYDPQLPSVVKATSKSALTTTMITGSTAAREALPPSSIPNKGEDEQHDAPTICCCGARAKHLGEVW